MKESKDKIKGTFKKNVNLMSLPLMSILPGQISFFVILSIIPLLSIIVMMISKLSFSFSGIEVVVAHYSIEDQVLSFPMIHSFLFLYD